MKRIFLLFVMALLLSAMVMGSAIPATADEAEDQAAEDERWGDILPGDLEDIEQDSPDWPDKSDWPADCPEGMTPEPVNGGEFSICRTIPEPELP
jgi:hypothetical protein